MFDSVKHRIPGGYIYEKKKLYKKISELYPKDWLAGFFYKSWNYRFWHVFRQRDDVALLKEHFAEGYMECVGHKFVIPEKDNLDTFIWEYPDLILPLFAENYNYEFMDSLYDEGPYEINEDICVREGDIVIDCGANMGVFCSAVSHKAKRIYAFEAAETLCRKYLEPLKAIYPQIEIVNMGLADRTGDREFTFYPQSIGLSSIDSGIGAKENASNPAWLTPIKETVHCISLDDYVRINKLESVDFIKADIEGAERELLEGAKETLARFAPKLSICTYHREDDKEVLERLVVQANPNYKIIHKYKKMYAYVDKTIGEM